MQVIPISTYICSCHTEFTGVDKQTNTSRPLIKLQSNNVTVSDTVNSLQAFVETKLILDSLRSFRDEDVCLRNRES